MRGMNRLAMGATLAVAVSLAMLLALLLFLLLRLLCLLLRDNRHSRNDDDIEAEPPPEQQQPARPLAFPFYGHGVLNAPTKYLLSVPNLEAAAAKQASPSPAQSHRRGDDFVSISNPIYDGTEGDANGGGTPFATPMASPSCFEAEDVERCSPPLKLMKKLPAVLPKSSLLFEGRRSLAASTETNRPSSSSSSNSLCSSPSW